MEDHLLQQIDDADKKLIDDLDEKAQRLRDDAINRQEREEGIFSPCDDEIPFFFKKGADGLSNTLNIDKDVEKIIKTAKWMEDVNTLIKNKIRTQNNMVQVDTLITEGEKLGCKNHNPIMRIFWGTSPSLIKLNKIKELVTNVNKRRKICESYFHRMIYYYLPDSLASNCVEGLNKALYECERYGIFEQKDDFIDYVEEGNKCYAPFSLEQLHEAQNYWIKLAVAEELKIPSPITETQSLILEERKNIDDVNKLNQEISDKDRQIKSMLGEIFDASESLRRYYTNSDDPHIKTFLHNHLKNIIDRYNIIVKKKFSGTFYQKEQEIDQIWKSIVDLKEEVRKMEKNAKENAMAKSIIMGPSNYYS